MLRAGFERAHQPIGEVTSSRLECLPGLVEDGGAGEDVALDRIGERTVHPLMVRRIRSSLRAGKTRCAALQVHDPILSPLGVRVEARSRDRGDDIRRCGGHLEQQHPFVAPVEAQARLGVDRALAGGAAVDFRHIERADARRRRTADLPTVRVRSDDRIRRMRPARGAGQQNEREYEVPASRRHHGGTISLIEPTPQTAGESRSRSPKSKISTQ